MTSEATVAAALGSLAGVRHGYDVAVRVVPDEPGLYALYGDEPGWLSLGLAPAFEGQPLYVGKAERTLHGRDVRTHFAAGKTGSSTVRRSLAGLLAEELALVPIPRNIAKPDGSANFALDPTSEARLSDWMQQRLSLATWAKFEGESLDAIETAVVRQLRPPLNLTKVAEPRERLRAARKRLADIARAWQPGAAKPDVERSTSAPPA